MRIGLLDHMGYGNLGDAATQDALLEHIKLRLPDAEFVAFSLVPDDTESRHHIPCYPIKRWYPTLKDGGSAEVSSSATSTPRAASGLKAFIRRIPILGSAATAARDLMDEVRHIARSFRVVRSLDTLVYAGGGQFGELWKGPWAHPYNVFKFAVLARLAGVKLVIVNVGAGPLRTPLARFFVASAVRCADYASFRDEESQKLIRSIGVSTRTYVYPDSVYALDMSSAPASLSQPPLVGLNPMGYADPRIWPEPDAAKYASVLDHLTDFAVWLLGQNYRVKIFTSDPSVDVYAIDDLRQRLAQHVTPAALDQMFGIASNEVPILLDEMRTYDFVVTPKFHGVVFSHMLQKPVLAISYHNKINDLMRAAGHLGDCLDIDDFDSERLKIAFQSLVDRAPELRERFRLLTQARAEALNRQFDGLFTREYVQGAPRDTRRPQTGGRESTGTAGYRRVAEPEADRP
jgi:polysaccharide pyruvyl transferase WcaK-like protein